MGDFGGCYADRPVVVTGETGFKGAWLAWWLHELGARVAGVALAPPTDPSLHVQADLAGSVPHHETDVRAPRELGEALRALRPRVVFHLAARSLVRESYEDPVDTLLTNALGTLHVLEAVRALGEPCAVVIVTSDKCYEGTGGEAGHREGDPLGGRDPYSASKACAELVTASHRVSFLPPERLAEHGVAVASVRAGNVLGPGDWARDRLVPDCVRALSEGRAVEIRYPDAVRPWQHVLEPLAGYLWLGAKLLGPRAAEHCEAWNFGPAPGSWRPVRDVVERLVAVWGEGGWRVSGGASLPESPALRLDVAKAESRLDWRPVWDFDTTLDRTVQGYRELAAAASPDATRKLMSREIAAYRASAVAAGAAWAKGASA